MLAARIVEFPDYCNAPIAKYNSEMTLGRNPTDEFSRNKVKEMHGEAISMSVLRPQDAG